MAKNYDIFIQEIEQCEMLLKEDKDKNRLSVARRLRELRKQDETVLNFILRYRDPNNFPEYCSKLKIKTKSGALKYFKFKPVQKMIWKKHLLPNILAETPIRHYYLKSRQMGVSTLIEALLFWSQTLFANRNGLVVAHTKDKSSEIFEMQKLFYRSLPEHLRPSQKYNNRHTLNFSDKEEEGIESRITVGTADDRHLGASSTLQFVHLSEFARYEEINVDIKRTLSTLFASIPKKGHAYTILETTGHGENIAKDFWFSTNLFEKIFLSWVAEPDYISDEMYTGEIDPVLYASIEKELIYWYGEATPETILKRYQWREVTKETDHFGDEQLVKKEYPINPEEAFVVNTEGSIFKQNALDYYFRVEPTSFESFDIVKGQFIPGTEVKIFRKPEENEKYFAGIDVGSGNGGNSDSSVMSVLNKNLEQVAVLSTNRSPSIEFAGKVFALAKFYNNCKLNPEANSYGLSLIEKLVDLKYPHIQLRKSEDGLDFESVLKKYGTYVSPKTRPKLIEKLKHFINNRLVTLNCSATIAELPHFIMQKGKEQARLGYHDDHLMALALGFLTYEDEEEEIDEDSQTLFEYFKELLEPLQSEGGLLGI